MKKGKSMNTKTVKSSKINKVFFILAIILLTIILCLTYVHFGSTNIGYDGDEVFSYLSSNAEQGYKKLAALKDHTWYPSSYFRNALSVPSSCQFHYEIPIRNQATDVHPLFTTCFCTQSVPFSRKVSPCGTEYPLISC